MEPTIEQFIRDYIPQIQHMSLGTSKDNRPWVYEVHFAYDETLNLYFRSLTSRRHSQEIAANPHVAGNIVKQHEPGTMPAGVYFEGTAEKLNPGDKQDKALACIDGRFHIGHKIWDEAQRPDGHQFYKITVETFFVFGKLEDGGPRKYELEWNGGHK
jgi:uncharacterized protein YhbP (UPF0306 family)